MEGGEWLGSEESLVRKQFHIFSYLLEAFPLKRHPEITILLSSP